MPFFSRKEPETPGLFARRKPEAPALFARRTVPIVESEEDRKEREWREFSKKLGFYDTQQEAMRERLLGSFSQFSEAQAGRALGNILKTQALQNQRRGIEFSGLGSRGMAEQQAMLQGQSLGAQQGYASALMNLQAQNRDAFMRGEFGFMNKMDLAFQSFEFQKQLVNLYAKLQRDAESRTAMFDLASSIGSFIPVVGDLFKEK